jgi:photosystem II stability/assembly factor-like uncharacterized protein
MSCRLSVIARVSVGLMIVPLLLSAQEKKPCWLRDANSPAPATAYLLCEQGGLWTTTDSGTTWAPLETGSTERHRAFAWLDAKRGIAVGNGGMILATADGGKTWQPRVSGVKEHLMDITFIGQSGWIVGYQGVILNTADGGQTWVRQTAKSNMTLEGVFFLDKDHGWAVGWSGTILRTADGGKNWAVIKSAAAQWTLTAAYFRDANNGWVTGFAGGLLHSKDGGLTWTAQTSPAKSWLMSIAFDSAGRGWIAYDDGLLLSQDNGETWKQVPAGGRYFLGKLLPMDQALWAIGQSAVLQQSGTGTEWKKNPSLVAERIISADSTPVSKAPSK